jgi:hypothetical protein
VGTYRRDKQQLSESAHGALVTTAVDLCLVLLLFLSILRTSIYLKNLQSYFILSITISYLLKDCVQCEWCFVPIYVDQIIVVIDKVDEMGKTSSTNGEIMIAYKIFVG